MDPLSAASKIAGSGLEAQATRLRIVSENIANARTTGDTPGADPYRRKTITFGAELDRATGAHTVEVKKLGVDLADFIEEYDPGNPAADAKGYVKLPNVNSLVEALDMKEAQRAYEANLNVIETARAMEMRTLDIIKK